MRDKYKEVEREGERERVKDRDVTDTKKYKEGAKER